MAIRDWSKKKLVIDVDDDLINLNPDHPSYKKYMSETGPSGFAQKSLMYADLITVSVPHLAELYAPLNKNFYVNPNSMDFKVWGHLKKGKNKKLRIGWAGAAGHFENLKLIEYPIKKIKEKYDVEFVTFGQIPMHYKVDKHEDWVHFQDYPHVQHFLEGHR